MEEKTYVFGNSDQTSPLLAAMNSGGFGGNNAWWVIVLLACLWGGNGFGGRGGLGTDAILGALNGDTGRDMLLSAIQGNTAAISQLQSILNCDSNSMQAALASIQNSICQLGNTVGMSSGQIISAIQAGNSGLAAQLADCCCQNKLLATQQGYENRIAIADQTSILGGKIDAQTIAMDRQFCALKEREMQSRIDALAEANSTLRGQIDNANQTAAITSYVNSLVQPLAATVNEIKAATPSTVTVPYPQLTAVPTAALYGYGSCSYYNTGVWA